MWWRSALRCAASDTGMSATRGFALAPVIMPELMPPPGAHLPHRMRLPVATAESRDFDTEPRLLQNERCVECHGSDAASHNPAGLWASLCSRAVPTAASTSGGAGQKRGA